MCVFNEVLLMLWFTLLFKSKACNTSSIPRKLILPAVIALSNFLELYNPQKLRSSFLN
jgi:hypothetical protein